MIHHFAGLAIKDPDEDGHMLFKINSFSAPPFALLTRDAVQELVHYLVEQLEHDTAGFPVPD